MPLLEGVKLFCPVFPFVTSVGVAKYQNTSEVTPFSGTYSSTRKLVALLLLLSTMLIVDVLDGKVWKQIKILQISQHDFRIKQYYMAQHCFFLKVGVDNVWKSS